MLCLKVEGENLGSLSLAKDATFTLDVREGGGTEVRKAVEVSSAQQHELAGSKGTAHFVMKFDKSSRSEACINILDPSTTPALKGVLGPVTGADCEAGRFVAVAAFECRGLEPVGYSPGNDFVIKAANSSCQWQDVDLSLGEWTEYDDKAQESVGVYSIESQFKLHKC